MVRVSAAVLAGGASRRMGTDKRRLVLDGETLLARAVRTAAAVSDDILIVVAADRAVERRLLDGLPGRLVVDRRRAAGPLAGVEAALAAARHPVVLVLPVDAPGLSPSLLRHLIGRTLSSKNASGRLVAGDAPQPLPCVLWRSALPALSQLLDAGERRLAAIPQAIPMIDVAEADWRAYDPGGAWLANLNRPRDLESRQRTPREPPRAGGPL